MSRREDDAYQAWVDELSKQVSDEEKGTFEEWTKTASARETYRGYLREAEFHRRLNKLQEEQEELANTKAQLKDWFEEEKPKNEALLKERDELKKQLEELGIEGPPSAAATPGPTVSAEKLAELEERAAKVEVLDRLIPAALGQIGKVVRDSIKDGFDIDIDEVIKLSLQQSIQPYRAYEILTADERRKRYEKDREDERKKWFEEGKRAAQASPSPDHLQPSGPSVVDFLQASNKDQAANAQFGDRASRVAAALKELEESNF